MRALAVAAVVSCSGSPAPERVVAPAPIVVAPPPPPPRLPVEPTPQGPLPADVHPTREKLVLDLDPAFDTFGGTADLTLQLDHPRDVIWLHGRGLQVSTVTANGVAAQYDEVDPIGVARITLPAPMSGEVALHVAYRAPYDPQLVGVYRVKTAAGPAVFSKFEAIYARRAFPCFDEPAFKIPFELTVIAPEHDTVVSNEPVKSATSDARATIVFAPTPPLPTYLVMFAAGPFEARVTTVPPDAERTIPLPLRGIAIKGRGEATAYALAEERAIIAEQERYFGIAFPFDKLDLVAVPDFQSGAMENAGAITFRDSALLIDDKTASIEGRIRVAGITAHETAHQWFGDLVTMRWWDDLWLNEGFATFLATRTVRAIHPEFETDLHAVESTDSVMNLDGLASARRIRQPIETTHDITNAFDGITYEKGAAFLAMLEHFIGDEQFRRGIHTFLTAHARGNATTEDLVVALSAEAGRDLHPLVSSFLDQPGVPVVAAHLACEHGKGSVRLEQERWRAAGTTTPAATWAIPVCVRVAIGKQITQQCTLLAEHSGAIELPACADWMMPNADATGYYRFTMPAADLARLPASKLSTAERVSLATNLEAAFRSAALPGGDVLRASEPLTRDPHGAVATVPIGLVRFVDRFMVDGAARTAFRRHFAKLYTPAAKSLGWQPLASDSPSRRIFRVGVLGFLALALEDPKTLDEAAALGRRELGLDGTPANIDPDLAGTVLSAAAHKGDAKVFDALVAKLVGSQDAQVRQRMLGAIGSVVDPALVARALDLAIDPRLRLTERLAPVATLLQNLATRDLAWTWLKAHFDQLAPMLPDRYAGATPAFYLVCDRARADELRAFFTPRVDKLTGGPRNLAQALEAADQCIARVAAQQASVAAYVKRL